MTPSESPSQDASRKATLHCGVCGHAGPPAGDWHEARVATDAGERIALSCPDCETTLTRRRPCGEVQATATAR